MEKMDEFFTARVDGYDEHMLTEVEGCREAYGRMAQLVPADCKRLLDLGCGTGLELDAIFRLLPDVSVTGIDLTAAMLQRLRQKHPTKALRLICGSYFDVELGEAEYGCAVSFQTMHHFAREAKTRLYRRIRRALAPDGLYIECDYMVERQAEEDFFFAEYARLKRELRLPDGTFYHFDTPCTVQNQTAMLREAGFADVEQAFRSGNTTILVARAARS